VCRKYFRELNGTLQTRVLACRNFYDYVCGGLGSKQAHSVRNQVFEEFKSAVIESAWKMRATTPQQRPVQKAAQLYTSCARLVKEHDNEVPEIRGILRHSSLSWPQRPTSVNIVSSAMTLSKNWPWLFLARAELVNRSCGGYQGRCLLVTSSRHIPALLRMRQRIIMKGRYEEIFDKLRNDYLVNEATSITFSEHVKIEEVVVEELWKALNASVADEIVITRKSNISVSTPTIPPEDWIEGFENVFDIPPTEDVVTAVEGVNVFKSLLDLHQKLGPSNLIMYIGWYVVQMASIYTDSDVMLYYYGSKDQMLRSHLSLCFFIVQATMGYALNSDYAMTVAPQSVRADVSKLVDNIRLSFNEVLGKIDWFPRSPNKPSYFKEQSRLFENIEKSAPENLTRPFQKFRDMTRKLTTNMEILNEGYWGTSTPGLFSPAPYLDIGKGPAAYSIVRTSRLSKSSDDIILMPYALAFPLYQRDAPSSIKYATLGSDVVTLFSQMLYRNALIWNESTQSRLLDEIQCFLRRPVVLNDLRDIEWMVVYRVSSLPVLWDAYKKAQEKESRINYLSGLRSIHDDQLFFIFWCYNYCGEYVGPDMCNRPLRNSDHFRKAFGCEVDSPMHASWHCDFFAS
ncbi:unnamed protein product, partial [Ixodes hexagonus]